MFNVIVLCFCVVLNVFAADDGNDLKPRVPESLTHIVAGSVVHSECDEVQGFMGTIFGDSYTKQIEQQLNSPALTAICARLKYCQDSDEFRKIFMMQQATRMNGVINNPELLAKVDPCIQELSEANELFAQHFFLAFRAYKRRVTQAAEQMDQAVYDYFKQDD